MPLKIVYLLRVWQEVWEGEADALVDLVVLSEGCQGFEVSSSLQEALQGLLFLLQPAQFILEVLELHSLGEIVSFGRVLQVLQLA